MWGDTGDVFTHGLNHGLEVTRFVGVEPVAVVVFLQVIKKPEEIFAEAVEFNRDTCNGSGDRNGGSANSTDGKGRNCNKRVLGVWATGS